MKEVVCPACHSVTPSWLRCIVCNTALQDLADNAPGAITRALNFVAENLTPDWPARTEAHLHRQVQRTRSQGIRKLATTSTPEDQLAVIVKAGQLPLHLADIVGHVTTLGHRADIAETSDGTKIITARIPADPLRQLLWKLGADSLQGARRVRPLLERTLSEIRARTELIPRRKLGNEGKGVIVGFVDFGLDFVHRNFRDKSGNSRIVAIWDQKGDGSRNRPTASRSGNASVRRSFERFSYGRLIEREEIDTALEAALRAPLDASADRARAYAEEAYENLSYWPPLDSINGVGAHGTYVADVAAGNGLGAANAPGIAPGAEIIFVDISTSGTPLETPQAVGSTFGDSVQLLDAVRFIFDGAGDKPCVVNISLGTNGGPHDGSSLVEEALDRIVMERPNRAVVIAAGNSFGEKVHVSGRVPASGIDPDRNFLDLRWRMMAHDSTSNEIEIWYSRNDRFTVQVIDPAGSILATVEPGGAWEKPEDDQGFLTVVSRLNAPDNNDNTINVFFECGILPGDWTLRLSRTNGSIGNGAFHAWIERDDFGQSRFVPSLDGSYNIADECTLSSIACGQKSIVVGAYAAYDPELTPLVHSSAGPTRDRRLKPEISAPGELVLAAHSGTTVLRHRQSGTSVAAACVTGVVALMLAEARGTGEGTKKIDLDADQIRDILITTARKGPPRAGSPAASDLTTWDPRLGYGRVDALAAVNAVRERLSNRPEESSQPQLASVASASGD